MKDQVMEAQMNILMVGNNPIELSKVFTHLTGERANQVVTEIAFDFKSILDRLSHFHPHFIVIDDNIGKEELVRTVKSLNGHRKTKHIPITILKNSNYREAISAGVFNYVLKDRLTGESLYNALINSGKMRDANKYLTRVFRKRAGQLRRIFSRSYFAY